MKIQELERMTGLERPSIRFYEKEGLLNPKRLENGYRDYSEEDAQLLKKIKLLRRLGMSVEKIRELQQGSAALSDAIARQVSFHTSQIEDHRRCRAICEAIRDDGAVFSSLDAEHYLKLLREIRIDDRALGRTNFQEPVEKEIHPWRRWLARWLDYMFWGAIMNFVWFVLLRVRPIPGDFGNTLFTIGALALYVPMEAFLLHRFGTTPGKYIMGIRLEYIQGGNLPYSEAIYRSLRVYVGGAGLGIPLVGFVLYIQRYCQLTGRTWRIFARHDEVEGPMEMPWDEDTEFIYSNWNRKRGVAAILTLAIFVCLTAVTVLDEIKPRYRGDHLTVFQVADNYNATLRILKQDASYYDTLQDDGSKKPVSANTVVFDMNNSEGNNLIQFSYKEQDGYVSSVQIHHTWDRVIYLHPLQSEALIMASSLLLAQEGCGFSELMEFIQLYEEHSDLKQTSFVYRNLLVEWTIQSEKEMRQGLICGDQEEKISATLDFLVSIR